MDAAELALIIEGIDLAGAHRRAEKKLVELVELVAAVIALITRMRAINLELTKRVAHLTRKRPRSETLERLERQLVLPLMGLAASAVAKKTTSTQPDQLRDKKKRSRGGGRGAFPADVPRVDVANLSRTTDAFARSAGRR
jgi:hypothetical protein